MRNLIGLLVILFSAWPAQTFAQFNFFFRTSADPITESLEPDDQFEVFAAGHFVCIYRLSALPHDKSAVTDLSRILPVDRAVVHGRPGREVQALVDQMLGTQVDFHLEAATALNWGASGYFWVVDFSLFPKSGGFSGVPYHYRTLVNPDGSLILPDRYLCSRLPLWKQQDGVSDLELHAFSHIAFDDFADPVEEQSQLHGDQILQLATDAINRFVEKERPRDSKLMLRFREQQIVTIPVTIRNDGKVVRRRLWELKFVDGSLRGGRIQSARPLTVWVTPDGVVGKLSANSWTAAPARKKPDGK